jgi:hypothetical protein
MDASDVTRRILQKTQYVKFQTGVSKALPTTNFSTLCGFETASIPITYPNFEIKNNISEGLKVYVNTCVPGSNSQS